MPELPNCQQLGCRNNQLTELPELPNCQQLGCRNNQLTELPELSNCQILWCNDNQLKVLPELPNCQYLECYNNQLKVLPELPNCNYLKCDGNNDLYYNRKQSEKYKLTYPSPGHQKYFQKKWEKLRHLLTIRYFFARYLDIDQYLFEEIIKFGI